MTHLDRDVVATALDDRWIDEYVTLFNSPTPKPETLARLLADDYCFEDPFHRIQGRDAFARYLQHSHQELGGMQFHLLGQGFDGACWLLRWQFRARLRGQPWRFEGTSAVTLNAQGQVVQHRDFWDSAQFYRRLPLIGRLLRWVQSGVQRHLQRQMNR